MKILKYMFGVMLTMVFGVTLAMVLLFGIFSGLLLPAEKVELDKSGGCPQQRRFPSRQVVVEGYFGQFYGLSGGYESQYPYGEFYFSAEPGVKTDFRVSLVLANNGMNGPEKANRMAGFKEGNDGKRIPVIYDDKERKIEINPNDRVRITGYLDGCSLSVRKIEKL